MASVRLEEESFADPRFDLLGVLAGFNRYEALGRMAHLWRTCTQRSTYVLDEPWIVACLGKNGVENLIQSGLGERTDKGIRIKGTQGRIEWLETKRQAAIKGGQASANKRRTKKQRKGNQAQPEVNQTSTNGTPNVDDTTTEPNPLTLTLPLPLPLPPEKREEEIPAHNKIFKPPTLEEVKAYCLERGGKVNPEKWFNHYTSNGWMVGKNKMKVWKAAVITWETNDFGNGTPSPVPKPPTDEELREQSRKIAEMQRAPAPPPMTAEDLREQNRQLRIRQREEMK